jgi:hypothetical protein
VTYLRSGRFCLFVKLLSVSKGSQSYYEGECSVCGAQSVFYWLFCSLFCFFKYAFVVINHSKASTILAINSTLIVEAAVVRAGVVVFDVPLAIVGLGTLVKLAIKRVEGVFEPSISLGVAELTISVKIFLKYAFEVTVIALKDV